MMDTVFDYEDIQLIPAKCIVKSCTECDPTVLLAKEQLVLEFNTIAKYNEKLKFSENY